MTTVLLNLENSDTINSLWACELWEISSSVKTYIDDILVLRKYCFRKHIEQMIMISGILHAAGLKVNGHKCSLGLKYIPYLGYFITREGIKLNMKKVQGIMDIGRTATTTESIAPIGMI